MVSQQRVNPKLKAIIEFLDGGVLPTDEKLAGQALNLEQSRFTIQGGVFYVDAQDRENSP